MNALVKKEVRLLLPSWVAILLLSTILPWVWEKDESIIGVAMAVSFFGTILIALDSFGREFSLGIFSSLMSQPVERREIWRNKIKLLVAGVAIIFIAQLASYELWFHHWLPVSGATHWMSPGPNWWLWIGGMIALILVALSGGLWTVLLIRQVAAAFWITFLVPAGIVMFIVLLVPVKLLNDDHAATALFFSLAAIYSAAGFWLAHRLFHRAQDVAWTGGVINFSRWRYFERKEQASVSRREHRPFAALVKKEFQLHSVSLVGASALLALHILVFFLRAYAIGAQKNVDSFTAVISEFFWIFWLALPLVLGSTAVAEERKLGVMDGQFCLPVSRRRQFALKFLSVMIFGTLLGGMIPFLLEVMAAKLGVPNEMFKGGSFLSGDFAGALLSISALAAVLAWVSFLASTVTKNFLQAISLSIASCLLIFTLASWVANLGRNGGVTITTPLPLLIAIPVIPSVLLWLAWRNFSRFVEGWHSWRRNVLGIGGAIIFIAASSALIYNRAWEIFQPAELPHGAARFSLATAPRLDAQFNGDLLVKWPDGRIWYDSIGYSRFRAFESSKWRELWWRLLSPLPDSEGPRQFIAGSNWVAATARRVDFPNVEGHQSERITGYLDTVGVKRDGTLWISSEAKPLVWTGADMKPVGNETNWQKVARWQGNSFVMLKNDGTLWQWRAGTNHFNWNQSRTNWPTVRDFQPKQIGTDSNWNDLNSVGWWQPFARKTNGTTWFFESREKDTQTELARATNMDQVSLETFCSSGTGERAFIGRDGVLRVSHENDGSNYSAYVPVGTGTNWLAVAFGGGAMVALKSDGTLWKWAVPRNDRNVANQNFENVIQQKPSRMGIHNDWVGLGSTWGGVISLAADCSLWVWPSGQYYETALVRPQKQPKFLGNVLSKED
jgi:ABC-type transport system involved in multi-copper enzyme maturation permease subunit